MKKNTIFKKNISFKPSRPGGGTFHLLIELKEVEKDNVREWDSLEYVKSPITTLSLSAHSRGGLGQCQDFIEEKISNFSKKQQPIIRKILDIWKEYHLNDFKAGTKYQTELLSDFKPVCSSSRYEEACNYLESKDALYDRGYKYGTDWLYRGIPEDVIEFLKSL